MVSLKFDSDTVILFLKCLLILIILGSLIPKTIDYILYLLICKEKIHNNSILVYNVLSTDKKIINNFIYLLKLLMGS